jgi:hypothetical protein
MKPVEIVLRTGGGREKGIRENNGQGKSNLDIL